MLRSSCPSRTALFLSLVACSSASTRATAINPRDAASQAEVGGSRHEASADDARHDAPLACTPSNALTIDAGGPTVPKGDAGCVEDLECPTGEFCYAPAVTCVSPTTVGDTAGDGTGGHKDGGGGCQVPIALPTSCDPVSLAWSASTDVSRSSTSLVESDAVLATDGSGTVVAAWSTIPDPASGPQQLMQLAVSHQDGAGWTRLSTPADSASSASNDGVLSYDAEDGFRYVWEGYETDFKGAQHVWTSVSTTGDTWSAPEEADANGDYQSGGALDFPWLAVNPATHVPYVSYEAAPSNSNGSIRLVLVEPRKADGGVDAATDGRAPASLSLTAGARPSAYPDLARGVFDASGNYYAAWVELVSESTGIGGTLSGSTDNGIYFTRVDLSNGSLVPLANNVKVSGATDAVNFDGPSIAVSRDGSAVYVSYVVGLNDAVDVVVAKSGDRGQTWAPAVKVNDDGHCATHFHSSLLVDPNGRLYVLWYDNRDGDGHLFYAVSEDGGASFHPNRLVSAPVFPFDTFQYSTGWLGDFFEPAIGNGKIYAMWSDGRESDQSHVFFAKADLP